MPDRYRPGRHSTPRKTEQSAEERTRPALFAFVLESVVFERAKVVVVDDEPRFVTKLRRLRKELGRTRSADEIAAYEAAGFGRPQAQGKRPALLIIDVQYRTVGTTRLPFWESIKEFKTSCGEVGWNAVDHIAPPFNAPSRFELLLQALVLSDKSEYPLGELDRFCREFSPCAGLLFERADIRARREGRFFLLRCRH